MTSNVDPTSRRSVRGKLLFKFALIADTHIHDPGSENLSPWKTMSKTNERARIVMEQVRDAQPSFAIHLGDITNPVPHLPAFHAAATEAKTILQQRDVELFMVAGNHDVGDKCSAIAPQHPIDDYSMAQYEDFYGESYLSFDRDGIHFVIVNTSLMGSGMADEARQIAWLEDDLERHREQRIFLFSHYPVFMATPDEPAQYDNIEVVQREWMLALLARYKVEAAFAGHVHNFFYNVYGQTELYSLLSTGFIRHDYCEMFSVAPDFEYGRDDPAKIGWSEVEVYEHGHVLVNHRALTPMRPPLQAIKLPLTSSGHPKHGNRGSVGIHLREAWAQVHSLTYNGPVDEFTRRRARNDYVLLALWESGLTELRVPLNDLLDPEYRDRMADMGAIGHRFVLFNSGVPEARLLAALQDSKAWVDAVEIVLPWLHISEHEAALADFCSTCSVPVYLACVQSSLSHRTTTYKFSYFVSFGFDVSELGLVSEFHQRLGRHLGLNYTFRIGPDQQPYTCGKTLEQFAGELGVQLMLNVTLQPADLRQPLTDEQTAARALTSVLVAATCPPLRVMLDSFADYDRGYAPRHGLYDAHFNPRLAARVVANLQAILGACPQAANVEVVQETDGAAEFNLLLQEQRITIVVPRYDAVQAPRVQTGETAFTLCDLMPVDERTLGNQPLIKLHSR